MNSLRTLPTPALILDCDRLERNARRMRERLAAKGTTLRLHVKTGKNVEVARIAIGADTGPITVSTLAEAEYFIGHGFTDILYAVGIVPAKLARVAELRARGVDLKVIVDSVDAASTAAAARVPALIEIDSDGHRAGVRPDEARLIDVAKALGAMCMGVMTHAGDSYNVRGDDAIRAVAAREREAVVESARRIREAGLQSPIVSVGSTPTGLFGESFEGVTEVRVGVYVFFDLVMAGLGVCKVDDIAISVLGSVIGHQRERNWIITDTGWMAMSRDHGTASHAVDQGYGLVCDAQGVPLDDLIVVEANQEHGIIARRDAGAVDFTRFPIGTLTQKVAVLPCEFTPRWQPIWWESMVAMARPRPR